MIFTLNTLSKVFALSSFILSTLCLFAGSEKSILQSASVMTLDTSASEPTAAIKSVNDTSAADLGLKQFYSVHVLAYCEGNFDGDGEHGVTSCSKRTAPFAFNPANVFSAEFKAGFNVSDINWPDTITDDFHVMEVTTKAMSVLYIIGVAATGVTLLMEILLTQAGGRASMMAHLIFTVLSFVCLGVSSSVASVMAVQFVDLINRHGKNYGIAAVRGSKFLGMTWSAVGLLFLTVVISVITLPSTSSVASSEKEIDNV
ncbi:actin cortical patch SUR7/pH-response regulator pali [Talaromyces proteolyticus]|uniref:Actin cortical patch SUR7/pH-response regulator pali n=1 Tax=Talaromyces proteolyticus TaxID=1131652 RepID=A0AAD4PW99_9EURO|nr:actin cortical patch SUR7/pH-response regulator pali [Talaromyces proteolyticus]KAH8691299.1 actin cortical patch SUR7/pH-response regulator pali [Talaromyces proteolyticus]